MTRLKHETKKKAKQAVTADFEADWVRVDSLLNQRFWMIYASSTMEPDKVEKVKGSQASCYI